MCRTNLLKCLMTICFLASGLQANYYSQNFDSIAEGSLDLGDGSTIASTTPDITGVYYYNESWKALRLTQDGTNDTTANYAIPNLNHNQSISSFTADFDVLIKNDDGVPADGFSFNYGALGTMPYGGEGGMYDSNEGPMLSICWRTYDDPRSIKVLVNGVTMGSETNNPPIIESSLGGSFQHVSINWDASGLDLSYGGTTIFTDLDVSGFIPSADDLFAFAARTGDSYEDVFIDNVVITTVPEPATAALLTAAGLLILNKRKNRKAE